MNQKNVHQLAKRKSDRDQGYVIGVVDMHVVTLPNHLCVLQPGKNDYSGLNFVFDFFCMTVIVCMQPTYMT